MTLRGITAELDAWLAAGRPHVGPHIAPVTGPRTCPSYPERGEVFAARLRSGELVFVDADTAAATGDDVVSTRAHGPCVTTRCAYWAGNCQLGSMITRVAVRGRHTESTFTEFGKCPISVSCRWLAENGPAACNGCVHADYFMTSSRRQDEIGTPNGI
ncbi:MAG: hypothetical protein ACKOFF_04355 [Acidimicrobiales bacterium]